MSDQQDTLLEFPCRFPIKAMGLNVDAFDALVLDIVTRHAQLHEQDPVQMRDSRGGRYVSVTVAVLATSREQLDAIYHELSAHERVVMAL
jgi:uncharacterized protein